MELEPRADDLQSLRSDISELRNRTTLLEAENQSMNDKLRGKDAALLRAKSWFGESAWTGS